MQIMVLILTVLLMVGAAAWAIGHESKNGGSSADSNWEQVIQASNLVSEADSRVQGAIEYAMKDGDILNERSVFYAKAKEEFGRRHMEWVNEDLSLKEVPPAVFKTVLYGYGYMGYLDWKDIYDPRESLHSVAETLKKVTGKTIGESEWEKAADELALIEDQNQRANLVVQEMEMLVQKYGYQLVWFDEGGDSYAFFSVRPSAAEQLHNLALDSDHKFKPAPKF